MSQESTVLLIQPPSLGVETTELSPPLGLYQLVKACTAVGVSASVLDLNCLDAGERIDEQQEVIYQRYINLILQKNPTIVGFTSMALESHVCLELGRRIKKENPKIKIILGGPHFSSLSNFKSYWPWVDEILIGEGEQKLKEYLLALGMINQKQTHASSDTFYISKEEVQPYFKKNPRNLLCIETSRGCKFSCSFCYSPTHWGAHIPQFDTITKSIDQFRQAQEIGAKLIFVVDDNFLNSSAHAVAICDQLISLEFKTPWYCYATLRELSEEIVQKLARAGCVSVFTGIDAITSTQKKELAKGFYKNQSTSEEILNRCLRAGIVPTVALMLPPPRAESECDEVLKVAAHLRDMGCSIRLNTLSYYPNTKIWKNVAQQSFQYSELKPRIVFDAHPLTYENSFAKEHPALFPFHSSIESYQADIDSLTFAHIAFTAIYSFSNYLLNSSFEIFQIIRKAQSLLPSIATSDKNQRRNIECDVLCELINESNDKFYGEAYEIHT